MCNIGKIDKMIRIIVGLALVAYGLVFDNMLVSAIGAIPLSTALVSFCPLYSIFKLNTGCKTA